MIMPSGDFRAVFFPYCLQKQSDGSYIVLNRDYKPLGFKTSEHIDYAKYPINVKIRGIKARLAAKLSIDGKLDTDNIFLYNDATVPIRGKQNMKDYLARLEILAKLKLSYKRK
jgi:hypothetical protein